MFGKKGINGIFKTEISGGKTKISYVNDKNGFLTNIRNNTLISDLKNNLIKNGAKNIIVTDSNGKVQSDNSKLTSGQKITIITNMETKTYTVVVRGDVSGDGNITIHDLLLVQRYLVGKTQMELSSELGISQAQISRLEKNGIDSIKKLIL